MLRSINQKSNRNNISQVRNNRSFTNGLETSSKSVTRPIMTMISVATMFTLVLLATNRNDIRTVSGLLTTSTFKQSVGVSLRRYAQHKQLDAVRPALPTTNEGKCLDSTMSPSSDLDSSRNRHKRVSYYRRSVVKGGDGGRPQITALDMGFSGRNSGEPPSFKCPPKFDKNDFEMHVGKALDTLRTDYPRILTEDPDYSIFDPKMEVVDPSGVRVRGLKSYKNAIRLLHAIVRLVYCPSKSGITMRMCYDQARQNIRIHWNAHVVPREIFGGSAVTNYVDGISVYELDRISGNITEHRFERLLINDAPVMHEDGVIAALKRHHTVVIPSFIKQIRQEEENVIVQFQQSNPIQGLFHLFSPGRQSSSSLFALEATNDDKKNYGTDLDSEMDTATICSQYPNLDLVAYNNKNNSRKKFGLKPLSPDEFLEIEAQVQKMASLQKEKNAQQRLAMKEEAAVTEDRKKQDKNRVGILKKMFGNVLQDTCESNFDCERPEVCCDFGFQKRCCFGGSLVGQRWDQMQPIRVPADVNNYPGRPNDRPYPY